jgi:lipopolysaccharide biosynthesis regulator YciM
MLQQFSQWFLRSGNLELVAGLTATFVIGVVVGRLVRYRKEKNARTLPGSGDNAFFKGVQYLLSNDRDHAIEEFTKSVQVNSDTIETYVALGNLYRSKGDIDRAIRIRQTIILRPNIDEKIKLRALIDLGLDYRKGGFFDRALETFDNVLRRQPSNLETLGEIEKIYEEMKDWNNAFLVRQKISRLTKGDHAHILAHHQTEIGKIQMNNGEMARAKESFRKAISIHGDCIDAYLHLGDLYFELQDYKNAIATWKKVGKIAPSFTFLAYRRLEGAYSEMKNLKPVEDFLKECTRSNADSFTRLALARYMYNENDYEGALRELEIALDLDPSFWEARKFMGEILLEHGKEGDILTSYRDLLTQLNVPYLEFQCSNCGFCPTQLQWQCPQCKKWDTIDFIDSQSSDSSLPNRPFRAFIGLSSKNTKEEK